MNFPRSVYRGEFFFREFGLQDHVIQQIRLQVSLFQSIFGLTFSTSFLTLSYHLGLSLLSGSFPCGVFSCTIFYDGLSFGNIVCNVCTLTQFPEFLIFSYTPVLCRFVFLRSKYLFCTFLSNAVKALSSIFLKVQVSDPYVMD